MADEIRIPFIEEPHDETNPDVVRTTFTGANKITKVPCWLFPSGKTGRLSIYLPVIPPEIHATTPAAKIRGKWAITSTDTSNATKWYVKLYSVVPDSASHTYDPSAADFTAGLDSSVTDVSLGQYDPNEWEISIPNAMAVAGRELIGIIERNDGDAGDPFTGDAFFMKSVFVATKA